MNLALHRVLIWRSLLFLLCWPFYWMPGIFIFVYSLTIITDSGCPETFRKCLKLIIRLVCVCMCMYKFHDEILYYCMVYMALVFLNFFNSLVFLWSLLWELFPSIYTSFGYLIYHDDTLSFLCRWYTDLSLSGKLFCSNFKAVRLADLRLKTKGLSVSTTKCIQTANKRSSLDLTIFWCDIFLVTTTSAVVLNQGQGGMDS